MVGAENGKAIICSRGTSSKVTYFTDFEGYVPSTADVQLDANGGASVYADQAVTVKVYDSNGALVRSFDDGAAAGAVEVISQSFTGTDYVSGSGGASKPTKLSDVLDLWKDSAGAVDFKVLLGGSATVLSTAVERVYGAFFNVKAYGATGDGTTNDYAAIAAAMAAASAAGGGVVFFPPGTYASASDITLPYAVSFIGSGSNCTELKRTSGSAGVLLTLDDTTGGRSQAVSGIKFSANGSGVIGLLSIADGVHVDVSSCVFNGNVNQSDPLVSLECDTGTVALLRDCEFNINRVAGSAVSVTTVTANGGKVIVDCCTFTTPSTYNTGSCVNGPNIFVRDCTFDHSATTTGTFSSIETGSVVVMGVSGCEFIAPLGGTHTVFEISTVSNGYWFSEDSNIVPSSSVLYSFAGQTGTTSFCKLGTREGRVIEVANTGTPQAVDPLSYGVIIVSSTGAAVPTLAITTSYSAPYGAVCNLFYYNEQTAPTSVTLTLSGNLHGSGYTVADAQAAAYQLVGATVNSVNGWFAAGSANGYL